MRFSVRLRIGSEGQRIAVCGWVSESINSISIYVVKHPVRLAYRVIVGLLLARWLIENIQYPFTQEPWCMISIGTGQKLNIQGGWTYIHAFHSRVRDGSGFVRINCFCPATFVSVSRKLQHLRQVWIHIWNPHQKCNLLTPLVPPSPLRNPRRSESESESFGTEHLRPGRPNSSLTCTIHFLIFFNLYTWEPLLINPYHRTNMAKGKYPKFRKGWEKLILAPLVFKIVHQQSFSPSWLGTFCLGDFVRRLSEKNKILRFCFYANHFCNYVLSEFFVFNVFEWPKLN